MKKSTKTPLSGFFIIAKTSETRFLSGRLSRRGKIPAKVKHFSKEKRSRRLMATHTQVNSQCVKEEDTKNKEGGEIKKA